jgi:hypothetical protein
VLKVLRVLAGPEAPRTWLASKLGDAEALVPVAFSTMSEIRSSAPPYRYRKLREVPLTMVFDLPAMRAALQAHMVEGKIQLRILGKGSR